MGRLIFNKMVLKLLAVCLFKDFIYFLNQMLIWKHSSQDN